MGLRRRAPRLALAARGVRRSFVSIRRVVEVGFDGRGRAAQPLGDLRDRQALRLTVMPRECDRALALCYTIQRLIRGRSHTASKVPRPPDLSSSVVRARRRL
jgi:hypothetical protein